MSNSLRDQLLGLGFKTAPKPASRPQPPARPQPGKRGERGERGGRGKGADAGGGAAGKPSRPPKAGPRDAREIDLATAFAIRAKKEKDERIAAERQRQEEARQRREARAKLEAFVKDRALDTAEADHVRHFEYGGKIKRIHVSADQLKALNAGLLGVLQVNGRYLLVAADTLAQAESIFPAAVALKVDPDAPAQDDPYSDPKYQVPDDLTW